MPELLDNPTNDLGISLLNQQMTIDSALDGWKNQSMIAQTAVVDLLLDLRALANANGH